jgi:hypothetical protein
MPVRKKTVSKVIQTASKRAAGIRSIDPKLVLMDGVSLPSYEAAINDANEKMAMCNTLSSQLDEANNQFQAAERALRDLSDRVLSGVASRYGRDSDQYEMAGGTRRSERKKPKRKASAAPASAN